MTKKKEVRRTRCRWDHLHHRPGHRGLFQQLALLVENLSSFLAFLDRSPCFGKLKLRRNIVFKFRGAPATLVIELKPFPHRGETDGVRIWIVLFLDGCLVMRKQTAMHDRIIWTSHHVIRDAAMRSFFATDDRDRTFVIAFCLAWHLAHVAVLAGVPIDFRGWRVLELAESVLEAKAVWSKHIVACSTEA